MYKLGVVGAGTMGSGIAQKIALEGNPVTVVDISDEALERGRNMMAGIFEESVNRRILRPEQAQAIADSITMTTDFGALKDMDLVVEAVFEDQVVKAMVFSKLEDVLGDSAVIASNTSSFPISELAKSLKKPERFVGLHYFYHPVKNRLLEVIPGEQTSATALGMARRFCGLQGKVEILCNDSPGFVVNRFFVPWLNEAVRLLAEGVAPIEVIEATCKQGFRLGMGPFELMNVTGVPIAAHAADGLAEYLGDFYRPDQLLRDQIELGNWEIPESEEFSDAVFDRMQGVTWAVAGTLVDEGTCQPLDVDLGAQVGLRWPRGPFTLFNLAQPEKRNAALSSFSERHPGFAMPASIGTAKSFSVPTVISETSGKVATVSIARPDKSNALNEQVFAELDAALKEHSAADVLLLRGLGKNFAAGADLRFFIKNMEQGTLDKITAFTAEAQQVIKRLEDFAGKVVVVVDGFALGGGAEIMLAADVIVATPRALIGFPETGIGIFPGLGGGYRLAHRLGAPLAKYLIGTGQMLDGKSAKDIGLVDHCIPAADLDPAALTALETATRQTPGPKWAAIETMFTENDLDSLLTGEFSEEWQQKIQHKLRSKAPIALQLAFELIDGAEGLAIDEEYSRELGDLPAVFGSEDAMIGLKSVGKYKPEFSGK